MNHVSELSTSAQSLADIAFLQDFVFCVAPLDGHVIIFAEMLYGIFLLHDFI